MVMVRAAIRQVSAGYVTKPVSSFVMMELGIANEHDYLCVIIHMQTHSLYFPVDKPKWTMGPVIKW